MFQDVIRFSRLLGIQYIWVDSLCIIQDGDFGKDWRDKAIVMGQYYQCRLVTIVVTTSPDNSGGRFLARPPGLTGSLVRLPYRDAQGRPDGFNVRPYVASHPAWRATSTIQIALYSSSHVYRACVERLSYPSHFSQERFVERKTYDVCTVMSNILLTVSIRLLQLFAVKSRLRKPFVRLT